MNNRVKLTGIDFKITIHQGRNLVAKDRDIFHRRTTSDPYIILLFDSIQRHQTPTISKTLSPVWNSKCEFSINDENDANRVIRDDEKLIFRIFDEDAFSDDDRMGTVILNMPNLEMMRSKGDGDDGVGVVEGWFQVGYEENESKKNRVSGDLRIRMEVHPRLSVGLLRGNSYDVTRENKSLRIGLNWKMGFDTGAIEIDTSAVAVDRNGDLVLDETVYYGNSKSKDSHSIHNNGAIRRFMEDKEADKYLDREVIICDLDRVSSKTVALYFVASVVQADKTFENVESALVRFKNHETKKEICHFVPSLSTGQKASVFLFRISRKQQQGNDWTISIIEDSDTKARDFGSLLPEIKSYTRDINDNITINSKQRVAMMRKGGAIRLRDYHPDKIIPQTVGFGLSWDVQSPQRTDINLNSCVIRLDSDFQVVHNVLDFRHPISNDKSIRHTSNKKTSTKTHEDDDTADSEKMLIDLHNVDQRTSYIGFMLNSYDGQELDNISQVSFHLFDASTGIDIARFAISDQNALNGYTALMVGCLYRGTLQGDVGDNNDDDDDDDDDWCLRIVSEPAYGRVGEDNVDDLQRNLRTHFTEPQLLPSDPDAVEDWMMPVEVGIVEGDIEVAQY